MVEIPPYIRGLVFDCDGTIADTMPLHYRAWVQALREHEAEFPEAMFYEMAGIPTVRIIEILNERHGYDIPVQEAADHKESLYVSLVDQVQPIGTDTTTAVSRRARITLTLHGDQGWTQPLDPQTVTATLTRSRHGWRVDRVDLLDTLE